MPKIAVVLSGCGVYDGSEIHETAAAMAALTRGGAEVIFINVILILSNWQRKDTKSCTNLFQTTSKSYILIQGGMLCTGQGPVPCNWPHCWQPHGPSQKVRKMVHRHALWLKNTSNLFLRWSWNWILHFLSVRTESARIARAAPRPLTELTADQVQFWSTMVKLTSTLRTGWWCCFSWWLWCGQESLNFWIWRRWHVSWCWGDSLVRQSIQFLSGYFQVSRVLEEFHSAGKPQALCCIAPVVAAKVEFKNFKFAGWVLSTSHFLMSFRRRC